MPTKILYKQTGEVYNVLNISLSSNGYNYKFLLANENGFISVNVNDENINDNFSYVTTQEEGKIRC